MPVPQYWIAGDSTKQLTAANMNRAGYVGLFPHQQTTPDMTVAVESGIAYINGRKVNYAGGNTSAFTAPSASNKRIDLVCLTDTGTLSIVTGTPHASSPTVPTYPDDKLVICEVYLYHTATVIKQDDDSTNGYIKTDSRPLSAGIPLPTIKFATCFETSARFSTSTGANGQVTYGTQGVTVDLANDVNSFAAVRADLGADLFQGDFIFSARVILAGSTGSGSRTNSSFIGVGIPTVAGSGHTYTVRHIGFKLVRANVATLTLSATQADGTTESATSLSTSIAIGDILDFCIIKKNSVVYYYWRLNAGSWSTATQITTNIPGASSTQLQISSSDDGDDTSQLDITCPFMSFETLLT